VDKDPSRLYRISLCEKWKALKGSLNAGEGFLNSLEGSYDASMGVIRLMVRTEMHLWTVLQCSPGNCKL